MEGGDSVIESELQIGEVMLRNGKNPLLKDIQTTDDKKTIVIINFDTQNEKITLELDEVKKDISSQRYFYVGTAKGNSPQIYTTTPNLNALLNKTIHELIKMLNDGELKERLRVVKEKFYRDDVLDISKLDSGEPPKDNKECLKRFNDHLKKMKGVNPKRNVAVYSLKVDGKLISDYDEYRALVEDKIALSMGNERGICHLCGKEGVVSAEITKRLNFKYFITDKISFAPSLEKNRFVESFSICMDCFNKLRLAEDFIANELSLRWGDFRLYVIPKFILDPLERFDLERWGYLIRENLYGIYAYDSLAKLESELNERRKEWREWEEQLRDSYILNILFYVNVQSAFKIVKLIKDVPPSRLAEIQNATKYVKRLMDELVGPDRYNDWAIDFKKIGHLLGDKKAILDTYDALLSEYRVDFTRLLPLLLENTGKRFHGGNDISTLCVQCTALQKFLMKLNLYDKIGGGEMGLSDDFQRYVDEMKYDEQETALFLLGYLMGEIGQQQYKSGSSKAKPILNKLNFEGMGKEKLLLLVNSVAARLHQYKIFIFNEVIFSEMKKLLDKNFENWTKSPQENVFYILSGYGYATERILKGGHKNDREEQ